MFFLSLFCVCLIEKQRLASTRQKSLAFPSYEYVFFFFPSSPSSFSVTSFLMMLFVFIIIIFCVVRLLRRFLLSLYITILDLCVSTPNTNTAITITTATIHSFIHSLMYILLCLKLSSNEQK